MFHRAPQTIERERRKEYGSKESGEEKDYKEETRC